MTADEQADVAADDAAYANGTMDDIEAEVAQRSACAAGPNDLYWEDVDNTTKKWVPLHSHYTLDIFKHRFKWQRTHITKFGIAVTGDGANYSGGLSASRQNKSETGNVGTRTVDNVEMMWKAQWIYQKQIAKCYNNGYTYKTGRSRWIARERTGGFDAFTPSGLYRWSCDSDYRTRVGALSWVSQETTRTWKAWYEIAGVGLPLQASFDRTETSTEQVRAEYIPEADNSSGFLCGKGATIANARFVEEVR